MNAHDWVILAIAVLGVLHGPLGAQALSWLRKKAGKK